MILSTKFNYGFILNTKSADGEGLDAYLLGIEKPIKKINGICIAVIHRTNDDNDKLIVTPNEEDYSDFEIEKQIEFQEKWFEHIILRSHQTL